MARTVCNIEKNYLPASFNGVPFTCIEASSEHGRRGAEGEFPFGEDTAYADLGRRIRTYSLRGVFRDDDFVLQAAALIAACEMPGPGVLVHPTRGIISAACRSIRVNDSIEEGAGETFVDLEFVEGNPFPNGLQLIGSILGIALGGIISASRASFVERYDIENVSPARRPQAVQVAQDAVGQVADRYEQAIASNVDNRKWRALADLRDVQEEDVLASDTVVVDRSLALGMNAVALEMSDRAKFQAFRDMANWAAQPVALPSYAGEAQDAVFTDVRLLASAYMAQAMAETQYRTVGEALTQLDAVVSILDDEERAARDRCDNALHLEIVKFRTNLQTFIYNKTYNLPRIEEFNFRGGVHPLVAAYSIYNDAKRHRDLEGRNVIDMTGRFQPVVIAPVQQ